MGPQQAVQQIISTNPAGHQPQLVRAAGSRYMYLDAQSSLQFQRMNNAQRQEYLEQQGILMSPHQMQFGARTGIQTPRPAQQIIIQSHQVPPGMTRNQQIQWLQSQRAPVLIRQTNPGGVTAIGSQQVVSGGGVQGNQAVQQFQVDQLQKQQQFQRIQQLQLQKQQNPQQPGHPSIDEQVASVVGQNPTDLNMPGNKTKTALANLLNTRLGNNGNVVPGVIVDQNVAEPSASCTLRTIAQHQQNASMGGNQPVARHPQEILVIQQQKQQIPVQQQPQPPSKSKSKKFVLKFSNCQFSFQIYLNKSSNSSLPSSKSIKFSSKNEFSIISRAHRPLFSQL